MLDNNLILNRLFSQVTLGDILQNGSNSVYKKCLEQYIEKGKIKSNNDIIQSLYRYLDKNYRNEYFYKNTLFNKQILGKHSLNTTTALTEVPIRKSKADFIKINGKAVVYEIKTELDSLERLEMQLADYYKAFASVNVVTSESNEKKVRALVDGTTTGIIVLTKRNQFSERKKAMEDTSHLDKDTMFKVLRKHEFEAVVKRYYGFLPKTKAVFYYNECFKLFSQIPLKRAYELFIAELKKRNHLHVQNFMEFVPYELRFLVYFSDPIQNHYEKLWRFLKNDWRY